MQDASETFFWRVRTGECAPDGLARMSAVCDWLQEAASLNAATLAFSKSDFEKAGENLTWVLARLKVAMERFPRWGEKVSVLTFPRGGRRIAAYRDFALAGEDGAPVGKATSEWMMMDLSTRKPVSIPAGVLEAANSPRPPVFGDGQPFPRLRWDCRETSPDALRFRAGRRDLDLNGHVNNVRYVEWLLESRPEKAWRCRSLDIAFKSETLVGEEVFSEAVETEPGTYLHRVSSADGTDRAIAATGA